MALGLTLCVVSLFVLALCHSLLGERHLLGPLLSAPSLPNVGAGDRLARATLRLAWHLTSLAWLAIAVMLWCPAAAPAVAACLLAVSGAVTYACTRGRHFAWAVFMAGALGALSAATEGEAWQDALTLGAAFVLVALGLLHVAWALGVRTGLGVVLPAVDGHVAFTPGPGMTLLVAAGLLLFGWLALALLHVVPVPLGDAYVWAAGVVVAVVFAARTIGDFRLVGLFKRVHGTPFARWDDLVYTPLCFALSAALVCQLV